MEFKFPSPDLYRQPLTHPPARTVPAPNIMPPIIMLRIKRGFTVSECNPVVEPIANIPMPVTIATHSPQSFFRSWGKKGDVYDFMLFFEIFSILPIKA